MTRLLTTVHFKGFAGRLDYKLLAAERERAVKFLLENAHTIVWDGDLPAADSFTDILTDPRLEKHDLRAFRKRSEIDEFKEKWEAYCPAVAGRVRIHAAEDDISWDELGVFALKTTGAVIALTFGGGGTVLKELKSTDDRVKFYVIPAHRKKADGEVEAAALVSLSSSGDHPHLLERVHCL